jgi:N-methylhydantoinase B
VSTITAPRCAAASVQRSTCMGIDSDLSRVTLCRMYSSVGVGALFIWCIERTMLTNTKNTPIEAFERAFPMRVLRYRLRRGSGGRGISDGGEGIERDVLMLEDVTVSLITERRDTQPWGLAGGGPGAVGENWLVPQGDESRAERLPAKCQLHLKAGDVLRMLTPGGGGWGAP